MQIKYLNENTPDEIVLQIQVMIRNNWGKEYKSIKEIEKELFLAKQAKTLPRVYYIKRNKEVIATIGLLKHDLKSCKYSPWLANFFVKESYRLQGIGNMLYNRLIGDARKLGYSKLYLYAKGLDTFYIRKNWIILKQFYYMKLHYNLFVLHLDTKKGADSIS